MLATDRMALPLAVIFFLIVAVVGLPLIGGHLPSLSDDGVFVAQDTDLNIVDGTYVGASVTFDGSIISITPDLLFQGGNPVDGECLAWESTGSKLDFITCAGGGGGAGIAMQEDGVSLTGTTTIDFEQGILAIDVGSSVVRVRLELTSGTLTDDTVIVGSATNIATEKTLPDCPTNALGYDTNTSDFTCNVLPINATSATDLFLAVRNTSGSSMDHGDLVYITGFHTGSGKPTVSLADANGSGTFPVIGFIFELAIANNANGDVIVQGRIDSDIAALDTSACSADDEVYLSNTPGVFTCTRPTSTASVIDELGIVLRAHATLGEIEIIGSGHANDLPNLESGSFWRGNGSNSPTVTALSTLGGRSLIASSTTIDAEVELYARNCAITYGSLASDTADAGLNPNGNCAGQNALAITTTDLSCITSTGTASVTFDERTRAGINSAGTLLEPTVNCTTTLKTWPAISAIDNPGIAAGSSIEVIPGTVSADMVLHIWIGVTLDD